MQKKIKYCKFADGEERGGAAGEGVYNPEPPLWLKIQKKKKFYFCSCERKEK